MLDLLAVAAPPLIVGGTLIYRYVRTRQVVHFGQQTTPHERNNDFEREQARQALADFDQHLAPYFEEERQALLAQEAAERQYQQALAQQEETERHWLQRQEQERRAEIADWDRRFFDRFPECKPVYSFAPVRIMGI